MHEHVFIKRRPHDDEKNSMEFVDSLFYLNYLVVTKQDMKFSGQLISQYLFYSNIFIQGTTNQFQTVFILENCHKIKAFFTRGTHFTSMKYNKELYEEIIARLHKNALPKLHLGKKKHENISTGI